MSTLRVNQILDLNGNSISGIPTGTIAWFAATSPPSGWIECNGQSTSAYSALAAVVGSNVPDLRGEFVRGWDNGRGVDSGRTLGSTQTQSYQSHRHRINVSGQDDNNHTGNFDGVADSDAGQKGYIRQTSFEQGDANETRPRNVALMCIIKT